jgi:hypothetical protein
MSIVNCTIHGDCEESGSKCSFFSQPPLTISVLHKMFPYEGDFKFRLKVRGSLAGLKEEFVWLDLTDTVVTEFSSCMSSEEIEIQAVVVSLPQGLGNIMKYANYLDEVASEFSECTRPNRHPVVDLESENHESNRNKMRVIPGKEMLRKA